MIINSTYEFKSAIIVDESLLREIDELIKEDNREPEYTAYLENRDEIEFESIDELVHYDNYENGRIKELLIKAGSGLLIDFSIRVSPIVRYRSSVEVDFISKSSEESELIKIRFKSILKKHKQSVMHTFISKISLPSLAMVIGLSGISTIMAMYSYYNSNNIKNIPLKDELLGLVIIFSILLFFVFGSFMQKKFFSPIVYSIGYRKKELEKESKIKWNIIWTIIIPVAISLITKYWL